MVKIPFYVPHQLRVHADQHPNGDLEVRYDYPFSAQHRLPERVMRIPATQVPQELQADLNIVRDFLRERIVVQDVRIPHGKVRPKLQDGILTVVTRDEQRALPVVRLYCNETAAGLDSRVEREGRMEANDFSREQLVVWQQIRQVINGLAWEDFKLHLPSQNE